MVICSGREGIKICELGAINTFLDDEPADPIIVGRTPLQESFIAGLYCRKRQQGQWQRNVSGRTAIVDPKFGEAADLVFGIVTVVIRNNAYVLVRQVEKPGAGDIIHQISIFFSSDCTAVL